MPEELEHHGTPCSEPKPDPEQTEECQECSMDTYKDERHECATCGYEACEYCMDEINGKYYCSLDCSEDCC